MGKQAVSRTEDFRVWNRRVWEEMLHRIFPISIPHSAVWNSRKSIIKILAKVGSVQNLTHLFFPDGGGFDLHGACESNEDGCVELNCGGIPAIFKAGKLTFESFGSKYINSAYFRIQAVEMEASGVYDTAHESNEELTEIEPGIYINRSACDTNEYEVDGMIRPLPKGSRGIMRYLGGSFVIFAKTSIYNQISSTYDGRHSKMSAVDFREYVSGLARS